MSEGFVQGDAGEVKLLDILPSHLQCAFLTRERKEELASKYEADHPSTVVVRDWEEIPDAVIATLSMEERAQALADRKRLHDRRIERKANAAVASVPLLGGDPDRFAHELRRVRQQLAGLTPTHPEYDRLFRSYVSNIHQLEDACGLPQTDYTKGQKIERPTESPIAPEILVKFEKWKKLSREKREKSVQYGETPKLLELIRDDKDTEPDLQELATLRLLQIGVLV